MSLGVREHWTGPSLERRAIVELAHFLILS